jgi:tetratricopeptide (TPR) repeat protein
MASLHQKVVLIGWDGADWQIIDPLIQQGLMPTLKQFLEQGVRGTLSTRQPVLSPILWNTIATGKTPAKHGIHSFIEPNADNTGIQPVTSTSRKTKALWNILSQNGRKSCVVGWYASHPAEPINGAIVSDLLISTVARDKADSPLPPQSFHPPELGETLLDLRVFPADIGPGHVLPIVPSAGEIPLEHTKPLSTMQNILAKCGTTHAIFTKLLETQPWDFAAVYYETIDHFGHMFMPYHPPRMPHVPEREFNWYRECMTGIYRFHDMMLERTLQLAGPDAIVVLISDHGFLNDHLRPHTLTGFETPAAWHRELGIFAARGPGIRKGDQIEGASITDIAPTVLTMLGLPVGQDMDGKILLGAFDGTVSIQIVPSWDSVSGPENPGMHPPDMRVDPFEQQAALQQLVELGYISPPSADAAKAIADAKLEAQYNLVLSEIEVAPDRAIGLAEALFAEHPNLERVRALKVVAEIKLGRFTTAAETLGNDADQLPGLQPVDRHLALTTVALGLRDYEAAERHLIEALKTGSDIPTVHIKLGELHAGRRDWNAAQRAYERAIELDPDSAAGHFGLGQSYLHRGNNQRAMDEMLQAIQRLHDFPEAHLNLGVALTRLGLNEQAVKALLTALRLQPRLIAAHRFLAVVQKRLGHESHAQYHKNAIATLLSGRITKT